MNKLLSSLDYIKALIILLLFILFIIAILLAGIYVAILQIKADLNIIN